ncbi:MAG: hypothetical protein LBK46_02380, partial [Oscillospiraceae bacterium]|nr:hypothetical protein [Oscillospiraceae bacterium]
ALATSDGKIINQHFGRCQAWTIVEMSGGEPRFVERRDVDAPCGEGGHSDGGLDAAITLLSDCRAVLAARIGPGAEARLKARGLDAFEIGSYVDDALSQLDEYYSNPKEASRVG